MYMHVHVHVNVSSVNETRQSEAKTAPCFLMRKIELSQAG